MHPLRAQALGVLSRFRISLYGCLIMRVDALFELSDALLCMDMPVKSLADLTLLPEHRRGPGPCSSPQRTHHGPTTPPRTNSTMITRTRGDANARLAYLRASSELRQPGKIRSPWRWRRRSL